MRGTQGTWQDVIDLVEACGETPSLVCRQVLEWTNSIAWAQVADWVIDKPVRILIILLAAWVARRLLRSAIRRAIGRLGASRAKGDDTRVAQRAETLTHVLLGVSTAVVVVVAGLLILGVLNVALGPFLATAGIAGAALAFGAQQMVRDFLAGLFVVIEDQYGVGDVVDLGEATGTVEAVTLRATRLRAVDGTVWHVPNGEVRRAGNLSQEWARVVIDIPVAYGTDLDQARRVIETAAVAAAAQPDLAEAILDTPEVWGVEDLGPDGMTIRVALRVKPGTQWDVSRAVRAAESVALTEAGIRVPAQERARLFRTPPPEPGPEV